MLVRIVVSQELQDAWHALSEFKIERAAKAKAKAERLYRREQDLLSELAAIGGSNGTNELEAAYMLRHASHTAWRAVRDTVCATVATTMPTVLAQPPPMHITTHHRMQHLVGMTVGHVRHADQVQFMLDVYREVVCGEGSKRARADVVAGHLDADMQRRRVFRNVNLE